LFRHYLNKSENVSPPESTVLHDQRVSNRRAIYAQLGVSGEAVKVDIVMSIHLDIRVGAVSPLPIAQKPNCAIGGKQSWGKRDDLDGVIDTRIHAVYTTEQVNMKTKKLPANIGYSGPVVG
jgi:hypothetical protein